jgi:hypothetical protein
LGNELINKLLLIENRRNGVEGIGICLGHPSRSLDRSKKYTECGE